MPDTNPDDLLVADSVGTKLFEAPEASGEAFKPKPLDIWALGVSIYAMMFGVSPFGQKGISEHNLTTEIKEKDPVLDFDDKPVSQELKDALIAMLDKDPTKRPNIK